MRLSIQLEIRLNSPNYGKLDGHHFTQPNVYSPCDTEQSIPPVELLLGLFHDNAGEFHRQSFDWLFSYANPRILRRLIDLLTNRPAQPGRFGMLQKSDPSNLLPSDYFSPDLQRFQRSRGKPENALVCLSVNGRMNMPIQYFHLLVAEKFDLILYLRDDRRLKYRRGIPGLGSNIEALASTIRHHIPENCHTAMLSYSSGGIAATRISQELDMDKLALFSPLFYFKDIAALDSDLTVGNTMSRLYFARNHPIDRELSDIWAETRFGDSILWLEIGHHGTLNHFVCYDQEFWNLISWLAGNNED